MVALIASLLLLLVPVAHAQTPPASSDIQGQIDDTNTKISQLQAEIAQLQKDLDSTSKQKQTLQTAVKALDLNIQSLTKNITLTQAQISRKDKEIQGLSGSITDTTGKISGTQAGVADSLRALSTMDSQSLAAVLVSGGTLSSFFDEGVELSFLRSQLEAKRYDLSTLRSTLVVSKTSAESKRAELKALQQKLNQQKQGLTIARAEQSALLAQTKDKESNYQALIAQKKADEAKFEQDLLNYEAQLGLSVAAGSIPAPHPGVLRWPLDSVRITQYFGNTAFATQNPQIYGGKGHNAIDLAASPGTPVKAARGGFVLGTGNTDLTCPNASFGKWVFIQHDNGLSTLYAHLSVINVSKGESVGQGQVLGYSGSTGYATGPHLHFGVYATSGSEIASFPSQSCKGKIYTVPLADPTAYLNPLSYLPAL